MDQAVPLRTGPNVTLIAALTPAGLGALLRVDGAANGAVFAAYLDQVLGPTLQAGDVVVLDNCPVHKGEDLAEIVRRHGARLLYLPPYSPDFTPIENAYQAFGRPSASSKPGCARFRRTPATCWRPPSRMRPSG